MNKLALIAVLASLALVAGCREHHRVGHDYPPPELDAFYMVDSYGVNTDEDSFTQPALSPYVTDGLFEVFWDVYNEDGYYVELSINDIPSLVGREIISKEYCGPGRECDYYGEFLCEYNEDSSMSCDLPSVNNPGQNPVYFNDLVTAYPQTMYLMLDICDPNSDQCEYQIMDVVLE